MKPFSLQRLLTPFHFRLRLVRASATAKNFRKTLPLLSARLTSSPTGRGSEDVLLRNRFVCETLTCLCFFIPFLFSLHCFCQAQTPEKIHGRFGSLYVIRGNNEASTIKTKLRVGRNGVFHLHSLSWKESENFKKQKTVMKGPWTQQGDTLRCTDRTTGKVRSFALIHVGKRLKPQGFYIKWLIIFRKRKHHRAVQITPSF